jgi:bifunctional DNA-binding transcriptional regulator/antitoxin component of YhaV-PrlF toxin-antitoxin module
MVVPKEIRQRMCIEEGDVFYVEMNPDEGTLLYAQAENPLLRRLEEGRKEYEAGLTKSLDEVAAELGIELNRG